MRVFLSFSQQDAQFARRLQEALRQRNIEVWSALDLGADEHFSDRMEHESERADALVLPVGIRTPVSPVLETEWRTFLRNDWESSKPLIPVLIDPAAEVPSFLRSRTPVNGGSMDQMVDQIEYLLKHPGESTLPAAHVEAKKDQALRLEELKNFALALKQAASDHSGDVKHR